MRKITKCYVFTDLRRVECACVCVCTDVLGVGTECIRVVCVKDSLQTSAQKPKMLSEIGGCRLWLLFVS